MPLQMRHELARQAEQQGAAPVLRIADYAQLIALAADQRDLQIKAALERDIRLVRLEDGHLIINLMPRAPHSLINDLSRKLTQWTGRKWLVALSNEDGAPTLREQRLAEKDDLRRRVESDEHVRAVMSKFPGAHIVDVRQVEKEQFDNSIEADTDIDND